MVDAVNENGFAGGRAPVGTMSFVLLIAECMSIVMKRLPFVFA